VVDDKSEQRFEQKAPRCRSDRRVDTHKEDDGDCMMVNAARLERD